MNPNDEIQAIQAELARRSSGSGPSAPASPAGQDQTIPGAGETTQWPLKQADGSDYNVPGGTNAPSVDAIPPLATATTAAASPPINPEIQAIQAELAKRQAVPVASGAGGTYTGGTYQPYAGPPDDSTMTDILTNTPIGKAIGAAGKWANDKIQNSIGNQVDAVGQTFNSESPVDKFTRLAAAAGASIPATAARMALPTNSQEASGMAMPTPGGAPLEAMTGAAGDVARGAGALAEGTVENSSKLFSKTSPQAFEMLRQDPEGVLAAARKGMTTNPLTQAPEAAALADAQAAGRNAQGIIDQSAAGAGKDYGAMMDHLHADVSGDKFDVAGKVYDQFEPHLQNQGASLRYPVGDAATNGAKGVMDIYDQIKSTAQEGMAPGDAADALQRLTAIQRNTPEVSAHAAALKDALLQSLPGEYRMPSIDTPTPEGWSIQDTRANYAAAKELQRNLTPFTNPQNPLAALKSVARAGGDASQSLQDAIQKIPALKAAIESMNINSAGAEFAPKFKTPPGTGLTGAAGLLGTKLIAGNAAALPATALSALGMSPRLTAESLVAGRNAGSAIMNSARGAEGTLPALLATLLRRQQMAKSQDAAEGQ